MAAQPPRPRRRPSRRRPSKPPPSPPPRPEPPPKPRREETPPPRPKPVETPTRADKFKPDEIAKLLAKDKSEESRAKSPAKPYDAKAIAKLIGQTKTGRRRAAPAPNAGPANHARRAHVGSHGARAR